MPLVSGEVMERGLSDAHERARKIDPQYSRGRLVRVAGARHQAEAEMLQILLLEEGVPSVMRRSAGADVPDFLAAGARDILVPQSGVEAARAVLGQSGLEEQLAAPSRPDPRQVVLIIGAILGGGGLIALIAWVLQHT
jgi:hypothetical protein